MLTEQQKTDERLKLRGEKVLLESENRKLKNTLKNIRLYLSEKIDCSSFTSEHYFNAESTEARIKLSAKEDAYSEILNYIKGKGY